MKLTLKAQNELQGEGVRIQDYEQSLLSLGHTTSSSGSLYRCQQYVVGRFA